MSITSLNEFPLHEISTNMSTIKFSLLIVGLIKFLLLQVLLHQKRISLFFTSLRSPIVSDDPIATTASEKKAGDEEGTVCEEEAEIVLKSLGILGQGKLPAKMEISGIFEEREASVDEVREAFDVFDDNRDGFIDEEDLHKVMSALGLKEGMEIQNCRRMIGAFDEDGDGRIDFHEFLKLMEIN